MARQDQAAGAGSKNLQAGRDLTVNTYTGLSADAYVIVERMIEKEVQRYTLEAHIEARRRLDEIYRDMIQRIQTFDEGRLRKLGDPGVQADLLVAGDVFVRSGREELKKSLIDLIALRLESKGGGLQSVVLSGAIETMRRLTPVSLSILTVWFLVWGVRDNSIKELADLEQWASRNIGPFLCNLPDGHSEYLYIDSTPAADSGEKEDDILDALRGYYPGLFHAGIDPADMSGAKLAELMRTTRALFKTCPHDEDRLQPAALNRKVANSLLDEFSVTDAEVRSAYVTSLLSELLPEESIRQTISENCPTWCRVVELYDSWQQLRVLRLSSIGVAIAICSWSSLTGIPTSLSPWITD